MAVGGSYRLRPHSIGHASHGRDAASCGAHRSMRAWEGTRRRGYWLSKSPLAAGNMHSLDRSSEPAGNVVSGDAKIRI